MSLISIESSAKLRGHEKKIARATNSSYLKLRSGIPIHFLGYTKVPSIVRIPSIFHNTENEQGYPHV
jgi:hypothetical protein